MPVIILQTDGGLQLEHGKGLNSMMPRLCSTITPSKQLLLSQYGM